jgi:hypothetical protein
MHTNPYREEVLAKLLADYKAELEGLTEDELRAHIQLQAKVSDMSDKQWAKLMKNYLGVHGTV